MTPRDAVAGFALPQDLQASDPLSVDFQHLAFRLEAELGRHCAAVLARAASPMHSEAAEPAPFSSELDRIVRVTLAEQLQAFRRDQLPPRFPDSAAEAARLAGDLDLILDLYRASHVVLWQAWFELVENADLGPVPRRELLSRGSDFFFAYAGRLADFAVEAHRRRLESTTEQRRVSAIRDLLGGDTLAAESIDFDLDRHHIGLLAWGEDPKRAARSLAEHLERPLLVVSPLEQEPSCWAWISATRPLEPAQEHALRDFDPQDAHVALGLEAPGEEGFRASHRQALRARRFAPRSAPPLIHYADVAVEALAAENEEDARAFVANELRGIEDDSSRSCLIRETLEAYFAAEYNAACAGAMLGIHQQTVANRLRAAEERLGQPSIRARRVELEMALRLRATLNPSDSQPAVSAN
jgi:DNA-binding PucR family transcriptional regulator